MKSFKFLIILLFLSINSFAQTSTGWQTIYESNIGKIDMMVTFNDPNAKKHMHQTGVYFRTNIPYSVHISVYCKEITSGYDNGKPRYNQQLQSTFFNKANNWRESDVLVSGDVKSFKGAYINYLEIDNQVLFRNGQEISQFYYNINSSNNSSSTNQNTQNSSNTSQNSTGSSGTSSMNRGGNIVTEGTSYNKMDTEKNQSYQQFKQNGEKLVKEQKFFEAKQEFQKSLQYSVNDSQIAYANKMIAFCDEYSKKNEKYDNVSKGIDIANDIINNISKKDNVFGKKTIDNSENLFKNNQNFQKIVNAINNNENVIVIKDCILNYFFELGFEIQNSYQTNDNLSFGYGFKNNIGMEVIKNPNKLIIQFPSDKNNFGKLMLKNLKNTNVIGKSILTNKYNIEYSSKNQIDLTNFSIDNQNTSSNNSLIEEIDAQKFNSNDMILKIKNYFEKLNYKYISTNNYSDDLSILKFEKFFISINSVSNYVSAISIDIPNENKHILNELKSKMITKKFKEKTIHQHSIALYYDVPLNQNINNNINNKLKFDNESYKTNLKKLQTDIQSFKNNKEKFKESLFTFFKNQNFNYFKTEIDNERGSINYYFNQNKSIGLIDYNNKLMLIFENENKNFGENLHKDLKSFDIAGFEKDNGKTYLIFFTFN